MKRIILPAFAAMALVFTTAAADKKEVTVTGEGQCAKCSMKEADKCQNVIKTADGKTYYLAQNATSKDFHHEICKENKKITATGTVKEKDGKLELTANKISVAQ